MQRFCFGREKGKSTIQVEGRNRRAGCAKEHGDSFAHIRARRGSDETVIAIGDIHGRLDLLERLYDKIDADQSKAHVVFLGDYIDRGDEAWGVLEYLMRLQDRLGARAKFLMGNHEAMLLDFLDGRTDGRIWMHNGGQQTLASMGLPPVPSDATKSQLRQARAALRQRVRPALPWLYQLDLSWTWGEFVFCHAGMDPCRPLEGQEWANLLWGHPQFCSELRRDDLCVVHGHYVSSEVRVTRSRIGVDTGAFFSGELTAVKISPNGFEVISSAA